MNGSGADNADIEDFQAGSTLCWTAIALLYLAAGVSGVCSFASFENQVKPIWRIFPLLDPSLFL